MKRIIACVLAIMLLLTITPTIIFAIGDDDIATYSCNHVFNEVEGSETVQCQDGKCGLIFVKPKTRYKYLTMKCVHCGVTTTSVTQSGCCS